MFLHYNLLFVQCCGRIQISLSDRGSVAASLQYIDKNYNLSNAYAFLIPLTPAKKKVSEFADFLICYCPGLKKRLSKYENFDFKLFVQKIGTLIF